MHLFFFKLVRRYLIKSEVPSALLSKLSMAMGIDLTIHSDVRRNSRDLIGIKKKKKSHKHNAHESHTRTHPHKTTKNKKIHGICTFFVIFSSQGSYEFVRGLHVTYFVTYYIYKFNPKLFFFWPLAFSLLGRFVPF